VQKVIRGWVSLLKTFAVKRSVVIGYKFTIGYKFRLSIMGYKFRLATTERGSAGAPAACGRQGDIRGAGRPGGGGAGVRQPRDLLRQHGAIRAGARAACGVQGLRVLCFSCAA
jgi:hypothetical protein